MITYNIHTEKETKLNPNAVPPHKGMSWDRPEDRARFVEAGYRAIEDGEPVPEGMIPTGTTHPMKEGSTDTVIRVHAWITPEQQAEEIAQKEAERQAAKSTDLKTAENAAIAWVRANVPGAGSVTKMPDDAKQKLRTKIKGIANDAVRASVYEIVMGLIEDIELAGGYLQDANWHEEI